MANDDQVTLLRKGSAVWNEWRKCNPEIVPDLSGADLSKAELSGADLSDAELSGAGLDEADLARANLSKANLFRADLFSADLSGTDLRGANLHEAFFFCASLRNADLRAADLSKANLNDADLVGADFSGTCLDDTIFAAVDLTWTNGLNECKHDGPSIIDFRTLSISKTLPLSFLRGCGLPDIVIEDLPTLRAETIRFCSSFISYSTKDQGFADRLHADLQTKGVRCWFAPHDLRIGAKTWDAIDEAIRVRDKLLLILSKASIDSKWVEDEVNKAYAEERSRSEVVLFPIRIDNTVMSTTKAWAVKLRDQRNIGDFRQWKKPEIYQKSFDRLLRDLKASGEK